MRKKLHIIKETISWILLIAVSVLFLFTIQQVLSNPNDGTGAFVFGYRPNLTLTGSMEPYMVTNGVFISKEVHDISEIAEGDVITFLLPTEDGKSLRIAHRIIDIDEAGFIYTKGDNNRVADGVPITFENVESKVVAVFNQTASLYAKWQTTSGKIMIVCFVIAFICAYILIKKVIVDFVNKKLDEIDGVSTSEHNEKTVVSEDK